MIFTIVIDFNDPNDVAMLEKIQAVFQSYDQEVLFVELKTDIEERLTRNRTENRLKHKPLKRNIEWSEQDIQSTMAYAVFNPEEPPKTLTHYQKSIIPISPLLKQRSLLSKNDSYQGELR